MSGFIERGPAQWDPVAQAADQLADHQNDVAHHARTAARNAVDYRGTTFSYGTGTGTSLANASHARHVHQLVTALARRRARLRHQVAEQEGDANTDEPGGVETAEYEVEASQERRDAAYQAPDHRRHAERRRTRARHGHGSHEAEEGDAQAEVEGSDEHHDRHGDHRGGQEARHRGNAGRRVNRHGDQRQGGGGGRQGGQQQQQDPQDSAPRKGVDGIAGRRSAMPGAARPQPPQVAFGAAIDTDVAGTGPLQRLAADLPRDALRDSRLHEAHFEQLWSLRRRAIVDPRVSFEGGVHAIEFDWNEAQRRHGTVAPQEGAAIRDRMVDAMRKDGAPPAAMPAARTASMNLLLFLVLLSSESPATPGQRRVTADTRTAQARLHRLARAASRSDT